MLTNNKQKTRKKNKNKITKLPMKYLTNWSIDSYIKANFENVCIDLSLGRTMVALWLKFGGLDLRVFSRTFRGTRVNTNMAEYSSYSPTGFLIFL